MPRPADNLRALLATNMSDPWNSRNWLLRNGAAVLALIDAAQERVDADPDAWLGSWLAAALARLNNPQETRG